MKKSVVLPISLSVGIAYAFSIKSGDGIRRSRMADITIEKAGISTNEVTSVARALWRAVAIAYRRWEAKPSRIEKELMEGELRLPSVLPYDYDQP